MVNASLYIGIFMAICIQGVTVEIIGYNTKLHITNAK